MLVSASQMLYMMYITKYVWILVRHLNSHCFPERPTQPEEHKQVFSSFFFYNVGWYPCLPPSDILVPTGRPGAQIQEPDLLHAGVHRAAVSMCQPLLPRCQVKTRAMRKRRRKKGRHGLDTRETPRGKRLNDGPTVKDTRD